MSLDTGKVANSRQTTKTTNSRRDRIYLVFECDHSFLHQGLIAQSGSVVANMILNKGSNEVITVIVARMKTQS